MPELPDPRSEKFAKLIVGGIKPGKAWLAAGYKAKTARAAGDYASKKKKYPAIEARIAELQVDIDTDVLKASSLDRQQVLAGLQEIIDIATGVKPSGKDKGGKNAYKINLTAAARARELQGKELGMFADRLVVENLDEEIAGMSAEQLRVYVIGVCTELGLKVVEMNDDQLRHFILRNAGRVGLAVRSEGADGSEAPEDAGIQSVPEAGGVPQSRPN